MRILAITSLYPRPGRESFAAFNRQQFRALAAENELRVIAPVAWTEEWRDRWKGRRTPRPGHNPDGIWVTHPRYYFPPKVLSHRYGECFLASIRASAAWLLEEFAPDVLLSCWAHPDGWATAQLARQAGLPSVIKVIGTDVLVLPRHPRRRTRVVEGLSQADRVVAVSRDLADQVIRLGVDPLKVAVVSEGVNTRLFRPGAQAEARVRLGMDGETPSILFVGNLLLSKGAGVLIEACRLLADRGMQFRCDLVGQGRDEHRLRTLIARQRLGDRVTLVGIRPHTELPAWYQACDLVVLPSASEGIPNVLRESLACGRPFVATRVGGIPEIADPAICRLVAPGAIAELATAIEEVMASRPSAEAVLAWSDQCNISCEESARRLAEQLQVATRSRGDGSGSDVAARQLAAETVPPDQRAHEARRERAW
jgi:teichuronic acid biosynthesis glycosyltransferase TuaC